jgi:hypothetical protein
LSRWQDRRRKRRARLKKERAETRKQLAEEQEARDDVAYAERVIERHRRTHAYLAVRFAQAKVGVKERPPGSNRGPDVDLFQAEWGADRGYPWCGAFVGWVAKKAGLKGLTRRVLYVPFIIEDAKAGRNGFASFVDPRSCAIGDFVCMDFGGSPVLGEHVGIARGGAFKVGDSWYVPTIEGNTSSSDVGSQSSGGMVASRSRPISCVVGCARPAWNGPAR